MFRHKLETQYGWELRVTARRVARAVTANMWKSQIAMRNKEECNSTFSVFNVNLLVFGLGFTNCTGETGNFDTEDGSRDI